ncbi:MAG TPA: HEAT repeat domain-containing protein, partial [Ktedonobacterales bacterium]|nr:HEAT repeat domain-containing protein [Ktedonobacterales bacterium]
AEALGNLRDRHAVAPLIAALEDADASVRYDAATALGQLRDRRALPALEALRERDPRTREIVAKAIQRIQQSKQNDT